jgi:hypothetical protein
MAQYAPPRAPLAVAVGTDPYGTRRVTPLTWGFESGQDEKTTWPVFVDRG